MSLYVVLFNSSNELQRRHTNSLQKPKPHLQVNMHFSAAETVLINKHQWPN